MLQETEKRCEAQIEQVHSRPIRILRGVIGERAPLLRNFAPSLKMNAPPLTKIT